MSIKLAFLGKLADMAGDTERTLPAPLDWEGLLARLDEALAAEVRSDRVIIAVDGEVLIDKTALNAGDDMEVALLPPVSGG